MTADREELRPGSVSIRSVRLLRSNFEINQDFNRNGKLGDLQVPFRFSVQRKRPSDTECRVSLSVAVFEVPENRPFTAFIQYEASFSVRDGDQQSLNVYSRHNALAMMMPFLREVLVGLTTKAGFPPLYIPPIDVREIENEENSEEAKAD